MKARSTEPERLDVETPPREMMARVVGYLAWVNRWLGGTSAVAGHLKGESGVVLDVAAGAGDIARALPAGLRPVVLDVSAMMLSFAEGLPRVRGDALRLPFADRSVDWVISTHFFHHLSDERAVAALREFDRIARRGIVVNDLLRNRRALFWIRLFTLWANPYVKADGPQSVRRGFTVAEAEELARKAGLPWLRVRTHFAHRFTLAGRRP
ncbi:MAG TPA: methyltransferase domain-containing protein [Planctomycetota bacterium]